MELRFTQAARRHRVGRGSVRHVVATCDPQRAVTPLGRSALSWVDLDERGRELEIVAVMLDDDTALVLHVMPTALRRK